MSIERREPRYLSPTNDIAFKKVFEDKERLKDFLNAVLRLEAGCRIQDLTYITKDRVPDLGQEKRSLFDLMVKDEQGTEYVIEMQGNLQSPNLRKTYIKRVQYYGARAYGTQLEVGQEYSELLPVVVVSVAKEVILGDEVVDCISYHRVMEDKTKISYLKDLTYVFVELGKFKKGSEELETFEDEWLYFLKNAEKEKKPPATLKDKCVLASYDVIERFNLTRQEHLAYIGHDMFIDQEKEALRWAEETGRAQGIEQGRQEGQVAVEKAQAEAEKAQAEAEKAQAEAEKAQAEKRALEEKAEDDKRVAAIHLLEAGVSAETVSKSLGIDLRQIEPRLKTKP